MCIKFCNEFTNASKVSHHDTTRRKRRRTERAMSLPVCALMDSPLTWLYTAGVLLGPMILSHCLRARLSVDALEREL